MEKTGYSDVDSLLRYLNDTPNDDHDLLRLGDEAPINEKDEETENFYKLLVEIQTILADMKPRKNFELTEEELKALIYLNSFA